MTMNINEKKTLYAFGCPNHEATIKRLRMLTALTPDPKTKKFFYNLSVKLSEDGAERWYRCYYYNMRLEMEAYFHHKKVLERICAGSMEEDYDEAD